MSNKILEYIEDIIYLKKHEDVEGLESLRKEGREKYVTLEEVGYTLLTIIDDLMGYIDTSQAIMEVRTKAIVYNLPDEIQEKILQEFTEVNDDLFNIEGEEL